jgi:hypothetical protein
LAKLIDAQFSVLWIFRFLGALIPEGGLTYRHVWLEIRRVKEERERAAASEKEAVAQVAKLDRASKQVTLRAAGKIPLAKRTAQPGRVAGNTGEGRVSPRPAAVAEPNPLLELFGPLPEAPCGIAEFFNSGCARKLRTGWLWRKALGVLNEESCFNWDLEAKSNAGFAGLPLQVVSEPRGLVREVEALGKALAGVIGLGAGTECFFGLCDRDQYYSPWMELMGHLFVSSYRSGRLGELQHWAEGSWFCLEAPVPSGVASRAGAAVGGKTVVLRVEFCTPEGLLFDRAPDLRDCEAWSFFRGMASVWSSKLRDDVLHPFKWAKEWSAGAIRAFSRFSRFYFSGACAGVREATGQEEPDSAEKLLGKFFVRKQVVS